jgi:hypothetical protein
MSGLITYKIVKDNSGVLKTAAKTACNFWNHYIAPTHHVVIRVGLCTDENLTIARSFKPYSSNGTSYGRIDFNVTYLDQYSPAELAGTVAHEIGHALGFGLEKWMSMFDHETGKFREKFTKKLPELEPMRVETRYGEGTQFAHWDEAEFGKELMTGFKDKAEFVMPVTVDVMELFGHERLSKLAKQTSADELMQKAATATFTRHQLAKQLDREHFQETEMWEKLPRG